MSPARTSSARRARDIGLDVRAPKTRCDDAHCPFHGRLPVRGQVLEGTVVSTAMQRTAVVERTLLHFVPKYERYVKRRRRYLAHAPPCLNVTVGHRVRIAETRPLSKLVSFCIVEDLGEGARKAAGEEPTPPPSPAGTPAPAGPEATP
ncbi:Ribosomal protein S17, archaeal [mine drainage metagenome]|uniref:Ribosomal protein S17, archaeal n=1 Tax=mine drainage metagenome TaxID=410659 RepID=T1B4J6_9ZZZZ